MTVDFESGLPSIRQIQNLIRETKDVELKLLTGETLAGKVRWQDAQCIALTDQDNQDTIVWRQAIAYLKLR